MKPNQCMTVSKEQNQKQNIHMEVGQRETKAKTLVRYECEYVLRTTT
jgi:hypothetical protein